ncbi:MAG: alpha/beta fold hydrolase [Acidimicrobiales bacterium]
MSDKGRVRIEENVVYGTGGGRDLQCDVFHPPGEVAGAPAVVLVHGGSWRNGDRTQLRGYGVLLGREGYVCVAPEYRLLGESVWPAQIHDVKAAIRWVRANAAELGVDPERIAIEGNSAGGHLALLAAGTPDDPAFEGDGGNAGVSTRLAAAIGVYPPVLFSHGAYEDGAVPILALSDPDPGSVELAAAASPLSRVSAEYPPTMLVHGTADQTVPRAASIRMYERLLEAGVSVDLHMYADQPHAFDAQPEFGRQCAAEMLLFLNRYVRNATPAAPAAAVTTSA